MKRMHLLRGLSAAAVMAICVLGTAQAQGKLEIVGGDTFDWGTVAPGKLTTVVEVKNIGNQDLNITEVRPSCGCTAAPIDKNLLKPDEIGKISITLDVSSRSGPTEKTVSISSNDPEAAVKILRLRANVRRALDISPAPYVMITDGKVGVETAATPVKITNKSDGPITIFPPEFAQGNVKVRFDMKDKRELKPGEEFELKAFVTPQEQTHIFGQAKMKTSSTEMPTLDLSISGNIAKQVGAADGQGEQTHSHSQK